MFPPTQWSNRRDYTSGASRFYELFVEGFDELASAHNAKAYALLDQLAKQVFRGETKPDDVPGFVLWARGMAAARMRKDTAAINDFQALLNRTLKVEQRDEIIPVPLRTNEYRFILAAIHEQAGDTAKAVTMFREAATADLGLDMAHVRIANILHSRGDFAAELQEREGAVASNPEDPVALFELALLLFDAGELDVAAGHLEHARQLGPRDARFPYLLGVIAEAQQRPADAKQWYQLCVGLAPLRLAQISSDASRRLGSLK
jgi:tetratricopeptide (TPR) repeat protein